MRSAPLPELMTVSEVAEALRVSPSSVYKWSTEGSLPTVRINTSIRFRREDIETLIATRTTEAAS